MADPASLVVLPSTSGHLIFPKSELDRIVAETLPQMPEGKNIMWGVGASLDGVQAAVVFHKEDGPLGADWDAKAAFAYSRQSGKASASVSITGSRD